MTLLILRIQEKHAEINLPATMMECKHRCMAIHRLIKTLEVNALTLHIEEQHQLLQQAQLNGDKSKVTAIWQKNESREGCMGVPKNYATSDEPWQLASFNSRYHKTTTTTTMLTARSGCPLTPLRKSNITYTTTTESSLAKHMAASS